MLTIGMALRTHGIERVDARVLLQHVLGVEHAYLLAHAEQVLDPGTAAAFGALVERRRGGLPVAYLTGRREFYGRVFEVGSAVLIPRPETELLVELALERLPRDAAARVLDLGTGSGCIAVSLALERPRLEVWAVERSVAALALASANAARLGAGNVRCVRGAWYEPLGAQRFDLIVSNPPYVAASDRHLSEGDLRFEPRQALSAGSDGLDAIRVIIAGAPAHLNSGGWLLLEHGYDQAPACAELLAAAGFDEVRDHPDLAGIPRAALGRASLRA